MNKKAILAISITLGLAFSGLNAPFTYAEDELITGSVDDGFDESTSGEPTPTSETEATSEAVPTSEDQSTVDTIRPIQCTGSEFHSYCSNEYDCYENDAGEQICEYVPFSTEEYRCDEPSENGTSTCEKIDLTENTVENLEENGTSGEGEVICADSDEPGCEEAIDPELWPLIISVSALAFCILFVIIINLINHKKKTRA